ncbi:MAG: hypothetical protein ACFFAN_18975 [Promethearchaeota archaeon]
MSDLANIFLKISAEKGNKFAKDASIKNHNLKIKDFLNNIFEFISINLQAECNRISSSPLAQLNTIKVGKSIKNMVEEQINRAIFIIEREKRTHPNLNNFVQNMISQINSKILENEKATQVYKKIFEMNLFHDFGRIVGHFRNLNVKIADLLFKYLILLNVQRRIARRAILPR